jgi:hypothetical protein
LSVRSGFHRILLPALVPLLLSSPPLAAMEPQAAPGQAQAAPVQAPPVRLRAYLALGAVAAAGLAYAAHSWLAPAPDAAPEPMADADPAASSAVAEVAYQGILAPALAAAGQAMQRALAEQALGGALEGPAEPAMTPAPASPDSLGSLPEPAAATPAARAVPSTAPSGYFNFMPAPGAEVAVEDIVNFDLSLRKARQGVRQQLRIADIRQANAAVELNWDDHFQRGEEARQEHQLTLDAANSIRALYRSLDSVLARSCRVTYGSPGQALEPAADVNASLELIARLETRLNAMTAPFKTQAWAAIARDANGASLDAQLREEHFRTALQVLEEIRDMLPPVAVAARDAYAERQARNHAGTSGLEPPSPHFSRSC